MKAKITGCLTLDNEDVEIEVEGDVIPYTPDPAVEYVRMREIILKKEEKKE